MYRICFLIVICFLLLGCQSTVSLEEPKRESLDGQITAIGYAGIEEQVGITSQEKQLKAMKASKLDAYRELAEQIYGLRLQSNTELAESRLLDTSLSSQLSGVIRGAKVVKTYVVGDSYVTELSLDLAFMQKLDQAIEAPIYLPMKKSLVF